MGYSSLVLYLQYLVQCLVYRPSIFVLWVYREQCIISVERNKYRWVLLVYREKLKTLLSVSWTSNFLLKKVIADIDTKKNWFHFGSCDYVSRTSAYWPMVHTLTKGMPLEVRKNWKFLIFEMTPSVNAVHYLYTGFYTEWWLIELISFLLG